MQYISEASHVTELSMPSTEVVRDVFETNVFGTVKVTNALLPHMRSRKSGLIVFLGSRAVWQAGTPVRSVSSWRQNLYSCYCVRSLPPHTFPAKQPFTVCRWHAPLQCSP